MKFEWSPEKNEWLKLERKISFEDIVFHLSQGDVWRISDHPDQNNYPAQKIYFVIVDDYVYLVPHLQTSDSTFLKTIIPSRNATKMYRAEKES
jgi:hypothetical protein